MPKLISEKQILKIKLVRNVLIVFLSMATALSIYNIFFIYPSLTELVIDNTKNDAVRVAKHLATTFMPERTEQRPSSFNADMQGEIKKIIDAFELNKLQVFSSTGEIIFSSEPDNIGKVNKEKYFHEIVARGKVFATVVKKDSNSMEGQRLTADVVETYVPQMRGNTFLGAFEIYYDITDRKEKFDNLLSFSSTVLFIVVFGLLSAIVLVWLKENKTIKERRRVEKVLLESEEKLTGILNSFTDFVILVDRDLNIVWSNNTMDDFFGTNSLGKKYYDVFHSRNTPCTTYHIEKCFQDGRSVEDEIECIGANGARMDLWYTASVTTRSEEGVPTTLIVVYRDITEKKRLRAEAVRSGQLASIGELAAGVAHEINNPINGIINCAQLLIDESEEGCEQAEIFQRIIKAGGRVAMIVRNLLSFARDTKDEPQLVTLKSLLSDCLDLTETQIRKEGIDLKVDIPDKIPELRVRSHHIQQVFLNIISNARYALGKGAAIVRKNKTIEIKGELIDSNTHHYVRLNFFDNGIGIPADIMDRICDPFFSSKPSGEGTGLGLSISHSIIKDHGGRLNFDSVEGDHTNVIIDLPVQSEDDFEKEK
ncbi:ATP-binding protein [Desulfobacula sp.]|uniref:two-component system sensor histidine kinase NtrB n=1 Tax=Desulfobacula sp. TaxID=2593537 RepID=UPI0026249023|nr:ATP-binding protein [Desulfobacula sp.]